MNNAGSIDAMIGTEPGILWKNNLPMLYRFRSSSGQDKKSRCFAACDFLQQSAGFPGLAAAF